MYMNLQEISIDKIIFSHRKMHPPVIKRIA